MYFYKNCFKSESDCSCSLYMHASLFLYFFTTSEGREKAAYILDLGMTIS